MAEKSFSVFNWPPPNTIEHTKTFFYQMLYFFLKLNMLNVHTFFYIISSFFLKNVVVFVNKDNCNQENILWWQSKNKVFRHEKLQEATKMKINVIKKIPEWFSITTIDPISFMKMLWSISAHWCFQKVIGSGLALWWSDTPQFKYVWVLMLYYGRVLSRLVCSTR